MEKDFGRLSAVAVAALVGVLAGCAAQVPVSPELLGQRIENVSSRSDHDEIASRYELQAAVNADAAKRHLRYAAVYRKNTSPRNGPEVHLALANHCENLARSYQHAADEFLAMAELHRELATQAK